MFRGGAGEDNGEPNGNWKECIIKRGLQNEEEGSGEVQILFVFTFKFKSAGHNGGGKPQRSFWGARVPVSRHAERSRLTRRGSAGRSGPGPLLKLRGRAYANTRQTTLGVRDQIWMGDGSLKNNPRKKSIQN